MGLAKGALRFIEGRIEDLGAAGVAPESADLVISNCVVNLSPDKAAVLAGAWRALAPGGEMHFADVYADRRLSEVRHLSYFSQPCRACGGAGLLRQVPGTNHCVSVLLWARCVPELLVGWPFCRVAGPQLLHLPDMQP